MERMIHVRFELSFSGLDASEARINFYDVAQALVGFQRSLALTTHLVLNNEIITQAPSLKGAEIYALPPDEGSWKFTTIILVGMGTASMAPRDSVVGHIIFSAYDYLISQTLGFHVDFDRSLGEQYEELHSREAPQLPVLDETRFDSLMDKCEVAIREMHRPIVKSQTADEATISGDFGRGIEGLSHSLTPSTYEYVNQITVSDDTETIVGKVSSYNINTYKGRIYLGNYNRPVPFEIVEEARIESNIDAVVQSMVANSHRTSRREADVSMLVRRITSKNDYLKGFLVSRAWRQMASAGESLLADGA